MNKSCFRFLTGKQVVAHGGFGGLIRHDERESVWRDQDILDDLKKDNEVHITRKLEDVTRENERIVKAKTGRKMQEQTMHVREAVVEVPEDCTLDDIKKLGETICRTPILRSVNEMKIIDGKKTMICKPVLDKDGRQISSPLGIKMFAAFYHKDEGHWTYSDGSSAMLSKDRGGQWVDPDGTIRSPQEEGLIWKPHYHAHLWFDMINKKTGKTIRPSAEELSQIQTIVAHELGMERGMVGSNSPHLDPETYRMKMIHEAQMVKYAEQERTKKSLLKELEKKIEASNNQIDEMLAKININRTALSKQSEDYITREEELKQMKTDIAANVATIERQEKTIADNEATIQKQETQKASTVINDDAADRAILEKYSTVSALAAEEVRLQRSIADKKTELATVDANVISRRKQLASKVDLDAIPKKGLMGYHSEDVDRYLESVNAARLRAAMNITPNDIKVDGELRDEVTRLRAVEDDYKDFKNSPERLQQRIIHLETEAKRRSIAEILKYALQKAVEVIRFTVDITPKGEDIFAKFTIKGNTAQYAGLISPEERISFTNKDLNSLQECKDNSREKIWWVLGSLSEIQAKREKEDTLSRYSTKLSTLLRESVKVKDYIQEGKHFLLFASNGRAYDVNPDGSTWSTGDIRVKTLADCKKYSKETLWTNHGDINNPTINTTIKKTLAIPPIAR